MTIVFTLFHITRRILKPGILSYLALIAYWLTFRIHPPALGPELALA